MAVQGALLQSSIPMGAKPVDVTGSLDNAYIMRGDKVAAERAEQGLSRENEDRGILQDYLKQGGNITTPDGIDKALTDLKGKVSSDSYLKLADHGQKQKESDAKYRAELQNLDVNDLKIRGTQLDQSVVYLSDPLKEYETNKSKGLQDAGAAFEAAKAKAIAAARQQKSADGKQLYPENVLQQIQSATPETLQMLLAHTQYQKDLVKQQLEQSQIAEHAARAKALNEFGPGGNAAGDFGRIDAAQRRGLLSPEEAEAARKGALAKLSKPADVSGLTPEATHDIALQVWTTGQFPQGRWTARERGMIYNEAAQMARDNGDTDDEKVLRKAGYKSNQAALTTITKQRELVAGFERDADKRLTLVQQLAHKADQNGVPALNRWINAGRKEIAGDNDVIALNSSMISLQAELAKVLSGSLTNAGVSDAARHEAQEIINKTFSAENIDHIVPIIRKEMKFKMDSYDEEIVDLKDRMKMNPKPGSVAAGKADKAKGESIVIYKDEAKKLRAIINDPDPKVTAEEKARAKTDLEGVLRELKGVGGSEDDAPPAPKAKPAAAGGWSIRPVGQ